MKEPLRQRDTSSIAHVVRENLCVGCGACKVVTGGQIKVEVGRIGAYRADIGLADPKALALASAVCPFANEAKNEDKIADTLFKAVPAMKFDRRIGHYLSLYGGRRSDGESASLTSSGGLTSWIAERLISSGAVDGVIHVGADSEVPGRLFSYCISETLDDVRARKKSQYYSVSFADAMLSLRGNGKKYLFIGVPCFVKAARLIADQDEVLRGQLRYFAALVCGHMKTSAFAELLAWQVDVPPPQLSRVDFRIKVEGQPSPAYQFGASEKGSTSLKKKTTRDMVGGNWGHAAFQLKACDFCDDIWGETADIAFGDAWLPEYVNDWRGTNVLAVRNAEVEALLKGGLESGDIKLDALPVEALVKSQDGNYRHRWDGLAVRLSDAISRGHWVPRKRIAANVKAVGFLRRRIVRTRQQMAELSHELFIRAKQAGALEVYLNGMAPLTKQMNITYRLINRPTLQEFVSMIFRKIRAKFKFIA